MPKINDADIRNQFQDAADFHARQISCCGHILTVYAIDGLTSGGDISQYIIKPIREFLCGEGVEDLYRHALLGSVVNAVAKECKDLADAARFLVNGFCVVLFPGVGAIAFEAKTGEKGTLHLPWAMT